MQKSNNVMNKNIILATLHKNSSKSKPIYVYIYIYIVTNQNMILATLHKNSSKSKPIYIYTHDINIILNPTHSFCHVKNKIPDIV